MPASDRERLLKEVGEPLGSALPPLSRTTIFAASIARFALPAMQAGITDRVWDIAELLA
jgi:hypothetical protein